ncbi:hypothetical protein KBD13_02255 [Patescibacteria group bacterium]|nr:hypothetical protein [Patescibacteria group bacterium]MDQ5919567.1 hypothetical protein [Patescibacteria group bacterium]
MAPRSSRQTVSVYKTLLRLGRSFSIVIGLVMVWRGIWYVLDSVDSAFFAGDYRWTAVGGILLGLALLYLPDGDLKELDKV